MSKLFTEFSPVSESEWIEKIKADLKGKELEVLNFSPEDGVSIPAYRYNTSLSASDVVRNLGASPDWKIRVESSGTADENAKILDALNRGANSLAIKYTDEFSKCTEGVLFEHISADLIIMQETEAQSVSVDPNVCLTYDPIIANSLAGQWNNQLDSYSSIFDKTGTITAHGYVFGFCGANNIFELACTIALLNEYLHLLSKDQKDISKAEVILTVSVSDNYFVNIAKFRAIRQLAAEVIREYNEELAQKPIRIVAKSSVRHLSQNDHNNNLIRQTMQGMAAVVGGCDELTIVPYKKDEDSARMARNIQLMLKEESYLDKVKDVAGGAYAIEELTKVLCDKAWSEFLSIEEDGGLMDSLKSNKIQDKFSEQIRREVEKIQTGEKTFIGVNKYPNPLEEWKDVGSISSDANSEFKPLTIFRIEEHYQKAEIDG